MYQKSVLFLVLVMLVFVGCTSDSKSLSVNPSKADFEDVYLGDTKDIVLTLKNKYEKDILITNLILDGSNDFTISNSVVTPIDMPKGSEYNLTLTFTPISDGTIDGLLKIRHTGATKDKEVMLTGNGVPVARISLSESSFDYQTKIINQSYTHNFEIENVGTAVLEISDMTFTGIGASAYSITSGPAPVNIQASQKHSFTVTFAPAAIGTYTADLAITHNAINESAPSLIKFEGEGRIFDPRIILSQSSPWDFGKVDSINPSTEICEIENTGIDPLTITSATLTTAVDFIIESVKDSNGNDINFPHVISVGAKIKLAIKFEPTVTAIHNDTLSIIHDGTNELSPLNVAIQGDGTFIPMKVFNYTGSVQQWTVPAGVTVIKVEACGAEGGIGQRGTVVNQYPGKGGKVTAELQVTPGDVLNIYVGGEGKDANNSSSGGGAGGWNGGGNGSTYSTGGGGGGGGASDIRKNGTNLTDRIIVAGGGGGSGCNHSTGDGGGQGGGLIGGNAVGTNLPNYKGYGGTQTAGGDLRGILGIGGDGDPGSRTGGGGGAGYYGGGGSTWQGAGGGSSYTESTASNVNHTQGVQSGDGKIVITY